MKSKRIMEAFNERAQELIKGCECGGTGLVIEQIYRNAPDELCYCADIPQEQCEHFDKCDQGGEVDRPCPTCADVRALELVVHEWETGIKEWVCTCGHMKRQEIFYDPHVNDRNPDLTTARHGTLPLLVHILKVLGWLEDFLDWHLYQIVGYSGAGTYGWIHYCEYLILLDGSLLVDAVDSFLQERGK